MGSGISQQLPEKLTKEDLVKFGGDKFNEEAYELYKDADGLVSLEALIQYSKENDLIPEWIQSCIVNVSNSDTDTDIKVIEIDGVKWKEIRLFLSSTFVDTQAERDVLVKQVIPTVNRKLAKQRVRIIPVDLRWGVLNEESSSCQAIQRTCLNTLDDCRLIKTGSPWFLGLRTSRYGWVQDDLAPPDEYNQPQNFSWNKKLMDLDKKVSITSLECLHAAQLPSVLTKTPTVFFYERVIKNPEEVEKDLKWVFDFEYVDNSAEVDDAVKNQYLSTDLANEYKADLQGLNNILQKTKHVKYKYYNSSYKRGNAFFTLKRENAKSFGVGYVSGLEEFASLVERDLLYAVSQNFDAPNDSIIEKKWKLVGQMHEAVAVDKASNFVGREELLSAIVRHVSSQTKPSLLILHGDPGAGKSGLVARGCVETQSCESARNGFFFMHLVDSCPGSSSLYNFLHRLQCALRSFIRSQGDIQVDEDPPVNFSELKKSYHEILNYAAVNYPKIQFIIIVDAVNQFSSDCDAWSMWWLNNSHINLRFVISTLTQENGTFNNAIQVCPDSSIVPVGKMSTSELEQIVSSTLARFNKKLTTTNDRVLGNQMEILLGKSSNPLYLVAVCESLRRFGIFEKVTQYLESFPASISDLFKFLLNEWSEEFTPLFVKDVVCLICYSKEGLLENELNDVLRFNEERQCSRGEFLYECSFARMFGVISGFLASGGNGSLRFFHDQLKYAVREKFNDENEEVRIHDLLVDFYTNTIKPRLCENCTSYVPEYYTDALSKIIYHQMRSSKTKDPSCFLSTLRNVYFLREKIVNNQTQRLDDEFEELIKSLMINEASPKDILCYKEWSKFSRLYSKDIEQFPQHIKSMALNFGSRTNPVVVDTLLLADTAASEPNLFPFSWINAPKQKDPIKGKFNVMLDESEGCCTASEPSLDIICSANNVFHQSSGQIMHSLDIDATAVALTNDRSEVWFGKCRTSISVYCMQTGQEKASLNELSCSYNSSTKMIWIQHCVGNSMIAGTGCGPISWDEKTSTGQVYVIDIKTRTYTNWNTGKPTFSYCFNKSSMLVLSGHNGMIQGWTLDGSLVIKIDLPEMSCVFNLASHPSLSCVLSGGHDNYLREWSMPDDLSILQTDLAPTLIICHGNDVQWAYGGNWACSYSHSGEFILSAHTNTQTIQIWNRNNECLGVLRGHTDCIRQLTVVPDSNTILSADRIGGIILWDLPELSAPEPIAVADVDILIDGSNEVSWVGFVPPRGDSFITCGKKHSVKKWDTNTLELLWKSNEDINAELAAFTPNGEFLAVLHEEDDEQTKVKWIDIRTGDIVASFTVPNNKDEYDSWDGSTTSLCISNDGSKLLLTECRNNNDWESVAMSVECSDVNTCHVLVTYKDHQARVFSSSIHPNSFIAATGSHSGARIWNLTTGQTLASFEEGCFFISFHGQYLLRDADKGYITFTELLFDDQFLSTTSVKEDAKIFPNGNGMKGMAIVCSRDKLLTCSPDGNLRIFDINTEECMYRFHHHQAQGYNFIALNPKETIILASNANFMTFILRTGLN